MRVKNGKLATLNDTDIKTYNYHDYHDAKEGKS